MLRVLKTNSLTIAIDDLNERLMHLRATPFEPVRIVVPASGIGRWVQQSQARRFGVSAHLNIDFAGSQIWSLAKLCLPDLPSKSPFAPPILVWRIDEQIGRASCRERVLMPV